ncbi:MAG: hypothetical protein H6822_29925 [Planctomycetaceae bacterium]|nr:hypothetical protein [Planctomycetaceae bacterium]
MARPREDASIARPLTVRVLGNVDHFRGSTLASMLERIGCTVTDRGGVPIAWLPRGETPPQEPSINRDADADKRHLADHFFRVFRYPLGVDQDYYSGKIVQKSLRNGAHDGQVLQGPVSNASHNAVYQHLIDNRTFGNRIVDLRVPFIGGIAPVCWIKCRPIENRFAAQSEWARLTTPDELFSSEEQSLITRFCEEVRLEYGELDVLRDVQCDSIYIVDVNPTPYPLTHGIDPHEWSRAVQQMAVRFQEVFLP